MDVGEEAHFTIIWRIENSCFPCSVKSPSFFVKNMEMTKWHLQIGCPSSGPVSLGIWREPEDSGPKSVEIKCELSFLGNDDLPLITTALLGQLEHGSGIVNYVQEEAQTLFLRRRAEFLQKDALTVRCRMRRAGTEVSNPDLCFAQTRLRADRRSFVWAIREFSTYQRGQEREFLLFPNSTSMRISSRITESEGEEFVSIQAKYSITHGPYSFEASLLDFEGKVVDSKELYYGFDDPCNIKISLLDFEGKVRHSEEKIGIDREYSHFKNFIKKADLTDDKESLLPNDVLSLRFEIEMNAKIVWSRIESYRYLNETNLRVIATKKGGVLYCEQNEIQSSYFKDAMKSLLEEGISSDVRLQAGGQSFPAHKCILSARSAVFRAMFNGSFKEKTSECVPIPDLTPDTLRELLCYIYTDTLGQLQWRAAADLYAGADKYQLLDLKRRCAGFLESALSESNFSAILTVADVHQDRELQEAVHEFVGRQGEELFTSDEWGSFREENPAAAWKIVEPILRNMKRNNGKGPRLSEG